MQQPFRIEALDRTHDRAAFRCGVAPLDRYLREQAAQDARRRVTTCYVALDTATDAIAGYYTLAADGVDLIDLPASLIKRLPRYPTVPVALVGRLAVHHLYRGRKIGAGLISDAIRRAMRSEIAVFALVVQPKDDDAAAYYRRFGFAAFAAGDKMLLSLGPSAAPSA